MSDRPRTVEIEKEDKTDKMKTRMIASFLVIALVAAVIGGASMAYFTAKQDVPDNVFVAGTVMIEAGEEFVWDAEKMDNVNPGDCFSKCVQIYNTGTKATELRLVGMEFDWSLNVTWITQNWSALCLSEWYDDWADLDGQLDGATPINPAWAEEWGLDPENGPVQEHNGETYLIVPVMAAPCPGSEWVMKYEDGTMEFYYADGPLATGEVAELCMVVVFDGPWMGNLWQGATFTMGGGMFQAVQISNNAPDEVWGEGWDDCFDASPEDRLANKIDAVYAGYFYDNGGFLFEECCVRPDPNNG